MPYWYSLLVFPIGIPYWDITIASCILPIDVCVYYIYI